MNHSKLSAGMLSARKSSMAVEKSYPCSITNGLTKNNKPDFNPLVGSDLTLFVEQNQSMHIHASPVMETLYEQILNTHKYGHSERHQRFDHATLGDDDFLEKVDRGALKPGVIWPEKSKGTNTVGTAIVKQAPTMIHADEHYLWANHFLTCSSAPIFDYRGGVIGVLDITDKACPKKDKDFGGCRCPAWALTGDAANTDPVSGKSPQHAMVEKTIQHAQQNCSAQLNIQPIPFRTDANSIKLSADNHSTTPTGDRA